MSHFASIKTVLSDRDCLIAALTELGLQPQVYGQARNLKGYYGNQAEYSAEIVIPANTIRARADVGFRWNQDSKCYEAIYDSYETDSRLGSNFFSHKLVEKYGHRVVYAKAAEMSAQLGEYSISESRSGTQQTLRLVFAAHQVQQQRR